MARASKAVKRYADRQNTETKMRGADNAITEFAYPEMMVDACYGDPQFAFSIRLSSSRFKSAVALLP